jgi:4-amino-4-deoxy-L-arabinose transferase-like glycosyltransferase
MLVLRPFLSIFFISLLVRIWFNCFACQNNAAFACDASEYLRHAQNILLTFNNLLANAPHSYTACFEVLLGQATIGDIALIKQIFSPLQTMAISGPVFPAFILFCYKIFAQSPSAQAWAIPVMVQSFLSALTCVLIALIGRACWGQTIGIVAGLIASLYPGFIINSGRLYSESFACFLLCLILWLIINYLLKGKNNYIWGLLLGISLFALQTTRSIMSVLSIIVIAFFIISAILFADKRKQIIKYSLALLLGFALCLLPWLILQKLAFGKASFIVDRVGQYNFFVGNDVDELGWLSIPYPDLSNIENKKYTAILQQSINKSPERFVKLVLDKPARLFKLPWNDFRTSIGPISFYTQTIFHQLILALAAIGIITNFSIYQQKAQKAKILARLIILFVALFHLVYLFFITVPRYGLTAMPEIILFSAVGLLSIFNALKERAARLIALKIILSTTALLLLSQLNLLSEIQFWLFINIALKLAISAFFLFYCWQLTAKSASYTRRAYALTCIYLIALLATPAYCLPIRANGRWYEWSKNFRQNGSALIRTITINQNQIYQLKNSQSYLAINIEGGSNLASDWNISINNHQLNGPFIPAMSLAQDLSLIHKDNNNYSVEQESILKSLCNVTGISPMDLRQWYLMPLNVKDLQLTNIPTTLKIIISKCANSCNTVYGAYSPSKNFSIIPSLFRFSWEKAFYGVENQKGLSDPSYDQKIKTNQETDPAGPYIKLLIPTVSTSKGNLQNHSVPFVEDQLVLLQNENKDGNFSNRESVLNFSPPTKTLVKRNETYTYWLVRLCGQINSSENLNTERLILWTSLNFSSTNAQANKKKSAYYISPWLPNYLNCQSQTNKQPLHFDICFPILISAFAEPLNNIELHLLQNSPPDVTKNLHINGSLQIYQMNKLPSGTQYEIL